MTESPCCHVTCTRHHPTHPERCWIGHRIKHMPTRWAEGFCENLTPRSMQEREELLPCPPLPDLPEGGVLQLDEARPARNGLTLLLNNGDKVHVDAAATRHLVEVATRYAPRRG